MTLTLRVPLRPVQSNAKRLADRLGRRGIALIGVTKAVDGEPLVGQAMREAGCAGLADSRLPALSRLAAADLGPLTLLRAPTLAEVEKAASLADRVLLSDPRTAAALAQYAPAGKANVLLTVDLGDRREGVVEARAAAAARAIAALTTVTLAGIAVNFACLSGLLPSRELFAKAEGVLASIAHLCRAEQNEPLLSLGGSCCIPYLEDFRPQFRTELRAGGALLFGYDFVGAAPLRELQLAAPTLTAVVLESYVKPPVSVSQRGRDAFGREPSPRLPDRRAVHTLLALGRRDTAPECLSPLLPHAYVAGMSSDHTVLITQETLHPGDTVTFALDYEGLVRAVTSPFVDKQFVYEGDTVTPAWMRDIGAGHESVSAPDRTTPAPAREKELS